MVVKLASFGWPENLKNCTFRFEKLHFSFCRLYQWREENPGLKGNIRDYATINELICLSNMENLNVVFIEQGMPQSERLMKLNQIAIHQMDILENGDNNRKLLK